MARSAASARRASSRRCVRSSTNNLPRRITTYAAVSSESLRCTGYGAILSAGRAVDRQQLRKIHDLYDTTNIATVLKAATRETLTLESGYQHLYKPATVAEAAAYLTQHNDTTIIAGGTDLGVQTNKGLRQVKRMLSTAALDELCGIRREGDTLVVGANTSLTTLELALLEHLPEYGAMLNWFGSPLIKNAGTLGGNIATARRSATQCRRCMC